jgi:hypothetical protein
LISRRDFLRLSALTMGAWALGPWLPFIRSDPDLRALSLHITNCPLDDILPAGAAVQVLASWAEIELTPGVYDWEALDKYTRRAPGHPLIVGVHRAPVWTREIPRLAGSRLKPEWVDSLYSFCAAVVEHCHPLALKLWNEPDVSPDLLEDDELAWNIGAWGAFDSAADGRYWGEIFTGLHQRLAGRVALWGPECMWPAGFFLGALDYCQQHGCLPDVVTYHRYQDYWHPIPLDALWSDAAAIHAQYGRPVCLSETNLNVWIEQPGFEDRQLEYFQALWETRPDWGMFGVFSLVDPEWKNAYLVDWSGHRRKAWYWMQDVMESGA